MTYRNPVIPGFHPDPSICRVGDEYFLATSTFTWFPGVPIFRSSNLTDWTLVGNALDRGSQLDLGETNHWASAGIFAPTLRHHDGRFFMITTLSSSRGLTNFFVTAEDPAGPWSDPVNVPIVGIDPDLAWDDDRRCWIHVAGLGGIQRCQIDDRTGERLGKVTRTWSGIGLQHPEAPHLYRIGEFWYLLIAEGGTERGHGVSIARGPSPEGPWESCPANPIIPHRSTDLPVQNTGHADLIQAMDGSWWMVLLGVRPRGLTPGWHVLGRETFLTSVEFRDGWPVVATVEPESAAAPPGADAEPSDWSYHNDFDDPSLDPSWIARRGDPGAIADLAARPGWLTITDDGRTLDHSAPSFVGRRQQHLTCRARARVDVERGEAASPW